VSAHRARGTADNYGAYGHSNPLGPLFPIIGLSVKMHYRQHDDFRLVDHIHETIGKPAQTVAPYVVLDERPSFRVFLNAAKATTDLRSKL